MADQPELGLRMCVPRPETGTCARRVFRRRRRIPRHKEKGAPPAPVPICVFPCCVRARASERSCSAAPKCIRSPKADSAVADLRRPGGDRHRECAAVRRGAGQDPRPHGSADLPDRERNILKVIALRRPMSGRFSRPSSKAPANSARPTMPLCVERWRRSPVQGASRIDTCRLGRYANQPSTGPPAAPLSIAKPVHVHDLHADEGEPFSRCRRAEWHADQCSDHFERAAAARKRKHRRASCFAAPRCSRSATSRSACCRHSPIRR